MSLISKQVKELRSEAEWQAMTNPALGRTINYAADTIEELSAKLTEHNMERSTSYYNGGWIPCSERLPEDRKEKLVYLSSGRMTVAIYNEYRLPHSGCSIGWGYRVPDGYIDFEKEIVVAWMPLPEPWKGETDENV